MNKVYILIWNATNQSWIAAPETAQSKSKTQSANKSTIHSCINGSRIKNSFPFSLCSLTSRTCKIQNQCLTPIMSSS